MRAALVVAQILITLVVVAVAMPVILVFVPAAQNPAVGPALALVLGLLVFTGLRLGWPRRAR